MDVLDPQFRAQGDLDRAWAQRTMTLLFLQHANVKVVAITRSSRIDTTTSQLGHTDAQVLLTGAQGLIPDRAAPYAVKLQWRREGKSWKLLGLSWDA